MTRVTDPGSELAYEAAQRFVDAALRSDDSLFTPGTPIWTATSISDLYNRFVEHPDTSKESFITKLTGQLSGAQPQTIQLAAEVLYVHFLPAWRGITGAKKRELINAVLTLLPSKVVIAEKLDKALEQGFGSAGQHSLMRRELHVSMLLEFAKAWKALAPEERDHRLKDPYAFKDFVFGPPHHTAFGQREKLLHLVFPDTFERIFAPDHKKSIVATYGHLVSPDERDLDKQIAEIRKRLTEDSGSSIDFYAEPLFPTWAPPRHPSDGEPKPSPEPHDVIGTLAANLLLDRQYLDEITGLLRDRRQIIFYGPPGTGKTRLALDLATKVYTDENRVELVQFHPSYAYEDFVLGYRPALIADQPGFKLVDGPLKRLAERARDDGDHTYVLVIDEINRANIAKVFGELYFLLEYRKRSARLQYSDPALLDENSRFQLSENLWIIGTMNTADRSIALMDAALRRRFYFYPFFVDEPPIAGLLRRWLTEHKENLLWLADVVDRANDRLVALRGRHATIGPSYFLRQHLTPEKIDSIWKYAVLPYLQEQFFGDEGELDSFALARLRDSAPAITGDTTQ